jgi:hypothetical protein
MIPFYLRLRGLNQLESALRELDTERLRSMVSHISDPSSDVHDPCTERLLIAELARRGVSSTYTYDARASFLPPVPAP